MVTVSSCDGQNTDTDKLHLGSMTIVMTKKIKHIFTVAHPVGT